MDIMLISELIAKLQNIKEQCGDIIICIENPASSPNVTYTTNLYANIKDIKKENLQMVGSCLDSTVTVCVLDYYRHTSLRS